MKSEYQSEYQNVRGLIQARARQYGEKPYLVQAESDRDLSYKSFSERCEKMGAFLAELGAAKGERVGILLQNSPEFAYAVMGAQWIGAVPGPINLLLKEHELQYILNHQEAKILITEAEFFPLLNQIKKDLTSLEKIVEVSSRYPHGVIVHPVKGVEELKPFYGTSLGQTTDLPKDTLKGASKIATWDQYKGAAPAVPIEEKDPALILYTSGTTGFPRGAVLSHGAILEVVEHLRLCAKGVPEDICLNALPLFHIFGIMFTLFGPLHSGATAVTLKSFQPEIFVQSLLKYNITIAEIVPTIAFILLQVAEKVAQIPDFPHLTRVICGAAGLPVAVHQKFEKNFGLKIFEGYGLTEACMAGCLNTTEGEKRKWGSVGKPKPGFNEIAIFDEQDRKLPPDQIGEVVLRGKNVMLEYLKDPQGTSEALKNGWLRTGDMGTLDADGYLYIVDRKKDMIIVGGENVYPREVEDLLATLPEVAEAAVIGLPHEKYGEAVVACVSLKKPGLSEKDIIAFCRKKLAAFKVPQRVLFFDHLPRTASGKVLKTILKSKILKPS